MTKKRKITYTQLMEMNTFLAQKVMKAEKGIDYTYTLFIKYIDYQGTATEFREFLKKENEKNDKQAFRDRDGESDGTDKRESDVKGSPHKDEE